MPSVNGKAQEMCYQIALDVLEMKVGDVLEMNFKDNPMKIKRVE